MIQVDISNVWGQLTLPKLLAMEKEAADAYGALIDRTGLGKESLDWMTLPTREPTKAMLRIQETAKKIREESDICVVVGAGGSVLGAKAAIELLQGVNRNLGRGKGDPQIFFAGNNVNTRSWQAMKKQLEEKDFSVIVISKSGSTIEPAIAFRALRRMLECRYGMDGAKKRIYAITDPCKGALRAMVEEEGWENFLIPAGVGGRYSVLTPVGLLPMAVAGIDIEAVMNGGADGMENYTLRSFENPVWLYATVRNLLYRNGKAIELLEAYEPDFHAFGKWWQQLFGESEGKQGKGLFPVPLEMTNDLHTLGQMIQGGQRNLFETMVRFDPPQEKITIETEWKNLDGLNYLTGKTLDFVEEQAYLGAVEAHVDSGVPVITIDCGELNARKVGELFYFMELACAISAYILGVNPFNRPDVAKYNRNLFELLGKPEADNVRR